MTFFCQLLRRLLTLRRVACATPGEDAHSEGRDSVTSFSFHNTKELVKEEDTKALTHASHAICTDRDERDETKERNRI